MSKFKRGDMVKVIGNVTISTGLSIGMICTVDEDNSNNPYLIPENWDEYNGREVAHEDDLELVNDTDPDPESTPDPDPNLNPQQGKFKVGDRVKLLDKHDANTTIEIGKTYSITDTEVLDTKNDTYPYKLDTGTNVKEEWLQLANNEEVLKHGFIGHLGEVEVYVSNNNNVVSSTTENKSTNKIMSVINKAFQSKESKAVVELGLGTNSNNLSQEGLMEFVSFIYETNKEDKKAFLAKLVEVNKANKEDK